MGRFGMGVRVLVSLLAFVLAAGCLSAGAPLSALDPPRALPGLEVARRAVEGWAPLLWNETLGADPIVRPLVFHTPGGCCHAQRLEVSVKWSHLSAGSAHVELRDASGATLAKGTEGWFASVAIWKAPQPGAYEIRISGSRGLSLEAVAQLEIQGIGPSPGHDLLPDIITLPPTRLQVTAPVFGAGASALRGCGADEVVEHLVRRCLRLDNRVGNLGEGALEVHLSGPEGAAGLAGQGQWVQRIALSDGKTRDVAVGPAVFHPTHGHFHYKGLAHYQMYAFDLAKHERGAAIGEGTKSGFCFIDIGLVRLGLNGTVPPRFDGSACADPFGATNVDWFMGLSPGWFDLYYWGLPEQYVEITGVPDGTYELVSRANSDGTLLESDTTNNEASVVFRLTGDDVEILESYGPGE